jgi:hypothetical protein
LRTEILKQVAEILTGVKTVEEIAEIETVLQEAKGKLQVEPREGFWESKTPCWEMFQCPAEVKNECPAFKYRTQPCWEIEGTYHKRFNYVEQGDGVDICQCCRVYQRWGNEKTIEVKLRGKEFEAADQQRSRQCSMGMAKANCQFCFFHCHGRCVYHEVKKKIESGWSKDEIEEWMGHETVQYRRSWYAVMLMKVNYVEKDTKTSEFKGMTYVKPREELQSYYDKAIA